MPAIVAEVNNSNVLQHYPATAAIARIKATAHSAETYAKKEASSREQLLKYII